MQKVHFHSWHTMGGWACPCWIQLNRWSAGTHACSHSDYWVAYSQCHFKLASSCAVVIVNLPLMQATILINKFFLKIISIDICFKIITSGFCAIWKNMLYTIQLPSVWFIHVFIDLSNFQWAAITLGTACWTVAAGHWAFADEWKTEA